MNSITQYINCVATLKTRYLLLDTFTNTRIVLVKSYCYSYLFLKLFFSAFFSIWLTFYNIAPRIKL